MAPSPFVPQGTRRSAFRRRLLHWYDQSKRDLPWRGERDPYRILLSEIMLQQTRVAVVKGRYPRFLRRFPDVNKLARAREQSVLAAWSGLGYYRRARALHAAGKSIARTGRFPRTSAELRGLPGVGRYTANAVASIAFGEAVPVVDGNVKRVLARFCGRVLSEAQYWQTAGELLDCKRPGDFNQAMMELGALVCLPATPLCRRCPLAELCASRGATSRRKTASRRKAVLNYALACKNGDVFLRQRPRSGTLMPGMWELPMLEDRHTLNRTPILTLRHSITTTDYAVRVFTADNSRRRQGRWVSLRKVEKLPLTGLTRKILRHQGF